MQLLHRMSIVSHRRVFPLEIWDRLLIHRNLQVERVEDQEHSLDQKRVTVSKWHYLIYFLQMTIEIDK